MSGMDWFPIVRHEDGRVSIDHIVGLYSQAKLYLPVVTENTRFIVLKNAGRQHSEGLMGRSYSPAQFEVWEKDGQVAKRVLTFPVRS